MRYQESPTKYHQYSRKFVNLLKAEREINQKMEDNIRIFYERQEEEKAKDLIARVDLVEERVHEGNSLFTKRFGFIKK